jgi:hypothetical protein
VLLALLSFSRVSPSSASCRSQEAAAKKAEAEAKEAEAQAKKAEAEAVQAEKEAKVGPNVQSIIFLGHPV